MKHKICDFKIEKSFQEEDKGIVEGYASTFGNEDRVKDVIEMGAFTKSLNNFRTKGQMIPFLFGHKDRDLPIGGIDPSKSFEDEKGLFISGSIDLDTMKGKDVFSLLKKGYLSSFSIGFAGVDATHRKEGGLLFKEIDLLEASVVNVPANIEARVVDVKTVTPYKDLPLASTDRRWDKEAADKRVREFTDSIDSPSSAYKNAFLWYDSDNTEDFGSYKLPYADVVDGDLKAVPRGIFAAAARLNQTDISEADKEKIKTNINKYYKKMGRDSPFEDKGLDRHAEDLLGSLRQLNLLYDIKNIFRGVTR